MKPSSNQAKLQNILTNYKASSEKSDYLRDYFIKRSKTSILPVLIMIHKMIKQLCFSR